MTTDSRIKIYANILMIFSIIGPPVGGFVVILLLSLKHPFPTEFHFIGLIVILSYPTGGVSAFLTGLAIAEINFRRKKINIIMVFLVSIASTALQLILMKIYYIIKKGRIHGLIPSQEDASMAFGFFLIILTATATCTLLCRLTGAIATRTPQGETL